MRSNGKGSVRNHTFESLASKRGSARSIFTVRALLVLLFFSMLLPADSIMPNRVLADAGDLVPGFGTNGVVMTDFAGGNDSAQAITTNLFGKIIAAGSATIPGNGTDFALASYDRNGNLDATFGQGGKATADFFGANDGARGAAVQEDGKIVLSGFATNGGERQWAFARFTFDGQLDPTFGQGGTVVLDLGSTSEAFKLALQTDGKIVAVGDSRPQASLDFTVVRLNPSDGSLDNSFGDGGVVRVDFGFVDRAIDLAIDEKNIFVGGVVVKTATDSDFGIARLNITNGSLNNAFDGDGKLTVDFFGKRDGAQSLLLPGYINIREKHLLVGGFTTLADEEKQVQAIAPINYQGILMDNFFVDGQYETRTFRLNDSRDQTFALFDEPDGGFGTAGWAGDGDRFDLGVAQWDYRSATQRWEFSHSYTYDTSSGANNVAFDAMPYEDTIITAGTGLNPATGNDDFIVTQHENEGFFEFSKHASPNPAVKGDIVTYTFGIKNLTEFDQTVYITDSLPDGATALIPAGDFRAAVSNGKFLISRDINVPRGETRRTTLRVEATASGLLNNSAELKASFGKKFVLGTAEVSSEVKDPEITEVTQNGKKLTVTGVFGSSSAASQSNAIEASAIEPQASCPVILIDGQEQKTKRDADNPSTVLIAKKGGKKIAPGQTVRIRVRLCGGIETDDFIYTRPQ